MKKLLLIIVGILFLVGVTFGISSFFQNRSEKNIVNTENGEPLSEISEDSREQSTFALPIDNYKTGQTKKIFGQYITPQNSPVQPERFRGYHTGIDVEQEQNSDNIPIFAISEGTIKKVAHIGGYGGVLIYETLIDNQPVSILCGHIRLSSVNKKEGEKVTKGEKLAVLGSPNSNETDGERKHLHFAIHKGSSIEYRGYVQNEAELMGWIDPNIIVK